MIYSYSLSDDISVIKGVGAKKKTRLDQLDIFTVEDLLEHFPTRYRNKTSVVNSMRFTDGEDVLAEGILVSKKLKKLSYRKSVLELVMRDDGGLFYASFFNTPFLADKLETGSKYVVFGKVRFRNGLKLFTNPEINEAGSEKDKRGIIPVYPLTSGLTANDIIKWQLDALANTDIVDWLSEKLRDKRRICDLKSAYKNIHFPLSGEWYRVAMYRLVYDKLLTYQLAIRKNRILISDFSEDASIPDEDISPFIESLGFKLTEGQAAAISDIESDLKNKKPMNRLVQGDVGCGKTVVAEAAIYKVVKAGAQAAFMAPTEILARQHYKKLSSDMSKFGMNCGLLVGSLKQSEKQSVIRNLKEGKLDILVGTHALITDGVEFRNLALVITDEQHRFGVNQRKTLVNKGANNVLVMSATPIPRTLAATVFGDMDFSVIMTMPDDRKEIITRLYDPDSRKIAYKSAEEELSTGSQVYIVAPSIENEEDSGLASAEALFEEMRKSFSSYKVGLIHGRLDKIEKERVMSEFASGKIDVLVSTVVIEVGIDVPNASLIIIENAERFGLAQLHQLRGRVGRSSKQSYCCLICAGKSETALERMKVMVEMSSGFDISEADLRLRGAGDIMGTIQHGFMTGRFADLFRHTKILEKADEDAKEILKDESLVDIEELDRRLSELFVKDNSEIL